MKEDRNKNAVDIFNRQADSYQQKFMDVSLYHDTLNFFCDQLNVPNAELLEVACGPGNITQYLLGIRPGLKITGTDLAPNMIGLAKTNNPSAEFYEMDGRKIRETGRSWDGVICGFLLPYLSKEEALQFIRDAAAVLRPGGLLYLSTMEDDNSRSEYKKGSSGDEIFMNFHEAEYLTKEIEADKMKVIRTERKVYSIADHPVTDLILISRKTI